MNAFIRYAAVVIVLPLMLGSVISVFYLWGFAPSEIEARLPPYRWSICRSNTKNHVVLTIVHNNTYNLLHLDLETGDFCLLTNDRENDDYMPASHDENGLLYFLQEETDSNETILTSLDADKLTLNSLYQSSRYEYESLSIYSKDVFYFSGTLSGQLATQSEIYRCELQDHKVSTIKGMTGNNRTVIGGVFCVPEQKAVYWHSSSADDPKTKINKSSPDFQTTEIVGEGSLIAYSPELDKFMKYGPGLGRRAGIELWSPEKGTEKVLAHDDLKYYMDACFVDESKRIAILYSDANYNVFIELISLADTDTEPTELFRLEFKEDKWVPTKDGKVLEFSVCKPND